MAIIVSLILFIFNKILPMYPSSMKFEKRRQHDGEYGKHIKLQIKKQIKSPVSI